MDKINIRRATIQDIPSIHGLVRELAIYEKEEAAFTATLEQYQVDFSENVFQAFVAELQGQIAGMALYYMTYSTWKGKMLYLEDFVVKSEFRKKGIGQLLFDAFVQEAKDLDCKIFKLQVLDWNEPAINFYKKNNCIIEQQWWNCKRFLE